MRLSILNIAMTAAHTRQMLCAAFLAINSCAFVAVAEPSAQRPSDIPIEAFAALPDVSGAKLSPTGKKIAYFFSKNGRRHLVVQSLDGTNPKLIPPWDERLEFESLFWKSDDIIIFRIGMTLNRQVFRGKSHETRTISLNLPDFKFRWLGKPKGRPGINPPSQFERIVDYLPNEPNHVLLELDFQLDGSPVVYRTNITNGARSNYKGGKNGINDWYADQNSEIRLGVGYKSKSSKFNAVFKNAAGKWVDLKNLDWADTFDIKGFTNDPNILYVSGTSSRGTKGLYRLDMTSGQILDEIFAHDKVDMFGIYEHPNTGQLAGVTYIDDFYRIEYLDKGLARLQRSLDRALPGTVNSIVSKSRDGDQYLVLTASDTNPGDYFLYDRPNRKMDWVMSARRQIDETMMSPTRSVSIPMRGGSEIPGYLTVPKGKNAKNLPTIILPHGGPTARDTADWDFWTQFYASRGYLVLKPNFRGSDGYGAAFERAGKRQWGGLMQDDVTDATKWLIGEGMADPDRICIVGASYGGYAALMGVIKEPGLYKCAVSLNGVTDLPRLKTNDRGFIGGKAWTKNMGLRGVDDEQVSPYDRAKDISAPVLLLSSKDDTRIPYKHSKNLHKKLKKLGKNSRYVMIKNGTHNMVTAESRLVVLRETEKFLAEHLRD